MAAQRQVPTQTSIFSLRNLIIAAGVAALAPYVIRRVLPLINRGLGQLTGNGLLLAGKDGLRDAADAMKVGGMTGKLKRAGGRIDDHVRADM